MTACFLYRSQISKPCMPSVQMTLNMTGGVRQLHVQAVVAANPVPTNMTIVVTPVHVSIMVMLIRTILRTTIVSNKPNSNIKQGSFLSVQMLCLHCAPWVKHVLKRGK